MRRQKKNGMGVGGVCVFENIHRLCKKNFSDASPNTTNKLELCFMTILSEFA